MLQKLLKPSCLSWAKAINPSLSLIPVPFRSSPNCPPAPTRTKSSPPTTANLHTFLTMAVAPSTPSPLWISSRKKLCRSSTSAPCAALTASTFEGGKLWFTAEGAKVLGSHDPATQKVDWVLGTGQDRTHMVYVFPGENQIITSNVSSATVTLMEKKLVARRPADLLRAPASGPAPAGPPRTELDGNSYPRRQRLRRFRRLSRTARKSGSPTTQDGTISIIDVAAKKVVQTLDANVRGANRLKFTPDGKLAFVSSLGGSDLVVFDRASRKERSA